MALMSAFVDLMWILILMSEDPSLNPAKSSRAPPAPATEAALKILALPGVPVSWTTWYPLPKSYQGEGGQTMGYKAKNKNPTHTKVLRLPAKMQVIF